jgi:hypothetical protein
MEKVSQRSPPCQRSRQRIEWSWKADADPCSSSESAEWRSYSDVEMEIIEEAYTKTESGVLLDDYYIDLNHLVQISNNNENKQRPIKRIVIEERTEPRLREARFLPNPLNPKGPFADLNELGFFDATSEHFNFGKLSQEDPATYQKMLVERAAEGLIVESKKVGKQKEGEWMAQQLLNVQNGTKQEVGECCARLYCKESFLYRKLNECMRLEGDEQQQELWKSKAPTLGPFAQLLTFLGPYSDSGSKVRLTVYRSAQLSDDFIQQFREKASSNNPETTFPAFTSTSRSRIKAEFLGGNVLFVIELRDIFDGHDVSPYSNFDEEEFLIEPYFQFSVRSCTFDKDNNRWIICLRSSSIRDI